MSFSRVCLSRVSTILILCITRFWILTFITHLIPFEFVYSLFLILIFKFSWSLTPHYLCLGPRCSRLFTSLLGREECGVTHYVPRRRVSYDTRSVLTAWNVATLAIMYQFLLVFLPIIFYYLPLSRLSIFLLRCPLKPINSASSNNLKLKS